jgi:hypothetical protein
MRRDHSDIFQPGGGAFQYAALGNDGKLVQFRALYFSPPSLPAFFWFARHFFLALIEA